MAPQMSQQSLKKSTSAKEKLAHILLKTRFLRSIQRSQSQSLTVLNYHRIGTPVKKDFDTFKPNISATPQGFEQQMSLISRWFNVISLNQIVAWLKGDGSLPPYAALITFDDGYLDNYLQAFPILNRYHFPALIFLTTDHIARDLPFYWDLIAYSFYHTTLNHVSLPLIGDQHWNDYTQLDKVIRQFTEKFKQFPPEKKLQIIDQLPEQLGVQIPQGTFRNVMMDWDQVRDLKTKGINFGGHTMTHPILTRISPEMARLEIEGSKACIESEIGHPVVSFAYPNGQTGDFNAEIIQMVAQAGYQAAFTLLDGPDSYINVQENPFEIKRIFISHKDTLARFAIKVCGINRIRSIF